MPAVLAESLAPIGMEVLTADCEARFERVLDGFVTSDCLVRQVDGKWEPFTWDPGAEPKFYPDLNLGPFVEMVNGEFTHEGGVKPTAPAAADAIQQFRDGFGKFRENSTDNTLFWRIKPALIEFVNPQIEYRGTHRCSPTSGTCLACGATEETMEEGLVDRETCPKEDEPIPIEQRFRVRARFLIGELRA